MSTGLGLSLKLAMNHASKPRAMWNTESVTDAGLREKTLTL